MWSHLRSPWCRSHLPLVPYSSSNHLWLRNIVWGGQRNLGWAILKISPFFRILFSPETQLTLNTACLPWDRVSLLLQTHLVCGTSSPLVIAGVPACAGWLLPSVASLGNSSHDDCQKHLLAHVTFNPGAGHPRPPTFKVLFYLFPGCTFPLLSSIYHMPLRSSCGSHMAACSPWRTGTVLT